MTGAQPLRPGSVDVTDVAKPADPNAWLKDLAIAAGVGGFSVGLVAGLVFFGLRAGAGL